MPGFNSNYFNRNLLESMKDSLRSMISEGPKPPQDPMPKPSGKPHTPDPMPKPSGKSQPQGSKFEGTAMGQPNVGIGGPADFGKVSDLQLQNRMRELKKHGLFGAEVKQSDEYLATEAEYKRRQEAKQPAATPKQPAAAEPPVPGLKGQASGADQRDIDAARTLPPSEPLKAPTTPPAALPKKASEFGSTVFGGPRKLVASTSTTKDGTKETTLGITPGETPRQREMASPELQSPIDLKGFWSFGSGNKATPQGKQLAPKDIRPAVKPEEQVPAPRQASGAQIAPATPGQIPQAVLDAMRAPMGPKALRPTQK